MRCSMADEFAAVLCWLLRLEQHLPALRPPSLPSSHQRNRYRQFEVAALSGDSTVSAGSQALALEGGLQGSVSSGSRAGSGVEGGRADDGGRGVGGADASGGGSCDAVPST